ncbi:MAG: sigma-70 family RNA polymerase sigma factor [Acidobacteriota bacterium]|nr:sigma-70 family RNA polymerase sigma factor [Acidobacteriota bacterium]
MTAPRRPSRFATTRWTMVNAAARPADERASAALTELCEIYWPPLYGYLRGRGYSAEQAQDLTQGFFVRVLETQAIRAADPARGRFRAFLLTALKRYVINEYERDTAARRGGRHVHFPLDFDEAERAYAADRRDDETPDRLFDRKWAGIALERALQRLRDECAASGKTEMATALLPYLTDSTGLASYRAVAEDLGLTEGAVKIAVHRLRQRYGAILRAEVAETVAGDQEVEAEMRELLRALSA